MKRSPAPYSLTIRPMRRRDAAALTRMMANLQAFHGDASGVTAKHFITYCLGLKKLAHAWIATVNKKPSGFAIVTDRMNFVRAKPDRTINLLYVEEEFRGQGISSAIIATIAKESLQKDFARLNISAAPNNRTANCVYKKLGFVKNMKKTNCYKIEGSALKRLSEKIKT